MKYKEFMSFYVKTGARELTDAVGKHAENIGYTESTLSRHVSGYVNFHANGKYQRCNYLHVGEELSIQEFFKLTKEDVIMQDDPKEKQDLELLHRLDDFFTLLLSGDIYIETKEQGLCDLLNKNGFFACDVFNTVIDQTKWELYSGRRNYPVPLDGMSPADAFEAHEDLWDKKHPYGRNRWKFVEWCHEQVKAKIEQANQDEIEFPVLVQNIHNKAVVLFTDKNSGVFCDDNDLRSIGHYSTNLWDIDNKRYKVLKTAKELGLQVRSEK